MYRAIGEFWSDQLNNEIYLKDHPGIERGSREYFETIAAQRNRYIYYLPEVERFFGRALPGQTLLEVGCGMGVDLVRFAHLGYDVTGIDLAAEHISLANKYFEICQVDGKIAIGNGESLDFNDESFDRVYSYGVLHHTPNTDTAIQEIYRVLRPEGCAFLMLYHKHSINNLVHTILRAPFENPKKSTRVAADAPFTHRFTKSEVRRMCRCFSYISIKTEYVYGAGYGLVYDGTPNFLYRWLSKTVGWHLAVYLRK